MSKKNHVVASDRRKAIFLLRQSPRKEVDCLVLGQCLTEIFQCKTLVELVRETPRRNLQNNILVHQLTALGTQPIEQKFEICSKKTRDVKAKLLTDRGTRKTEEKAVFSFCAKLCQTAVDKVAPACVSWPVSMFAAV